MIEASGSTTTFAPFDAASPTRPTNLFRFASTSPNSEEHWIAATFTVVGPTIEIAARQANINGPNGPLPNMFG